MVSLAAKSVKLLRLSTFSTFRFRSLLSTPQTECAWRRTRSIHTSSTVEVSEYAYDDHIPDDSKVTEKDTALRMALSNLSGEFGKESMLSLQRFFGARRAPVISTGSLRLDQALGIGGLPKGRMVEIYGQEASGKTTLALHVIKEAQKLGGYCAYLDVENAMDPSLAESIGVNTEDLLISQPDSAENLLSVVDTLTKSGSISVIVVDSVAALVPQCEVDTSQCGSSRDLQSKIMTQALRKIHYSLCNSNTLIIFINQVRKNLKLVEGSVRVDEVTCGGNALKFYAAIRMRISRKGLLKTEDKATGLGISVQVVKNKLAPSMAKAELSIRFGKGICRKSEALDLACEHGVIVKDGSRYFIKGRVLHSREEVLRYLGANDGALDDVIRTLSCKKICFMPAVSGKWKMIVNEWWLLLITSNLVSEITFTQDAQMGVCYGKIGSKLPFAKEAVALCNKYNIKRMRLYKPNQQLLQALRGNIISVILGVANEDIPGIARNLSVAQSWIQKNVVKFYNVNFRYIAVGNEISPLDNTTARSALFGTKIKVSTAISPRLLGQFYPPPGAAFVPNVRPYTGSVIKFLEKNNCPLLANLHLYLPYISNPKGIGLDYALFSAPSTVVRDRFYKYWNLFDVLVDAVYVAVEKYGGNKVEVVVAETGWPSAGGTAATVQNAKICANNLIQHVKGGTQRRPKRPVGVYVSDLIDQDLKKPEYEQHWGLFDANNKLKYPVRFDFNEVFDHYDCLI
ncbi:UNVERIFIED_CONTAM: DNA repair protein recA, mitochondrial [Sesamum indicum]